MKTIAITIDDATVKLLDELAGHATHGKTRSALIRAAVRDLAERERRRAVEEQERLVVKKHRRKLERQAQALIQAQARA
jgi:metal-responsive CopG/Arc/MetJ family transcriptional regulator